MEQSKGSEKVTIADRYREMNISTGKDTTSLAKAWLKEHAYCFHGFWNGSFLTAENIKEFEKEENINFIEEKKISYSFPGCPLVDIHIYAEDSPLKCTKAIDASKSWRSKSPEIRSETLYNIAKCIEKYQDLLAELESITSGKPLSRVKTIDIPYLIESFYFCAGVSLDLNVHKERGQLSKVLLNDTYPTLGLILNVAPMLCTGRAIIVFADWKCCLSTILLTEICLIAGLPPCLLNVIPTDFNKHLPVYPQLLNINSDQIAVPDDFEINSKSFQMVHFHSRCRPVVIIYENADLHAAVEGVLESFNLYSAKILRGGCKVLIQQSIADIFMKILKEKFVKLPKFKKDCFKNDDINAELRREKLANYVQKAAEHGQVFALRDIGEDDDNLQPMIISGVESGFALANEELDGPIIVCLTFRTQKESISMFNCDNKGSPVSVWTEVIPVALEVAEKLQTGTIWINSQNIFDPRIPFSCTYSSGNAIIGGKEEIHQMNYGLITEEKGESKSIFQVPLDFNMPANNHKSLSDYKLFIDGALKQSSSAKVVICRNSIIPWGSEADVLASIQSARLVQPKWQAISIDRKREILLSIAEKFKNKKNDFVNLLEECGISSDQAEDEVLKSINTLRHWAFEINNLSGKFKDVQDKKVLQSPTPFGIIGIVNSNSKPFYYFVSSLVAAIALGNTAVVVPSEMYPEPALKLCEIFSQSVIPRGVINVITGPADLLLSSLLKHTDVNAIWIQRNNPNLKFEEYNYKRICVLENNIDNYQSINYLLIATFVKSIYLPKGDIFAN